MRLIIAPQSPPCVTGRLVSNHVEFYEKVRILRQQRGQSTIFSVAQREHEFVACFGVLSETETALLISGRPAEVWKRRGNDVEGGSGGGSGGEEGKEFGNFEVVSWP